MLYEVITIICKEIIDKKYDYKEIDSETWMIIDHPVDLPNNKHIKLKEANNNKIFKDYVITSYSIHYTKLYELR